jgi:hypothetical protein
LEDFKTNQGARQTYCIQLIQLYAKRRLEKDSSLRQIVICKTNWKARSFKIRQTKTKSTAEVKADMVNARWIAWFVEM